MLDDILFLASKMLGPLTDPRIPLYFALLAGVALLWTPWRKAARLLLTATMLAAIVLGSAPIGVIAVNWIENRIPPPARLPDRIDGIVVLGGDVDSRMMRLRPGTPGFDATRQIAMADLARRYPSAKLVYSGGSGQVIQRDDTDSDGARLLLPVLGLDPARVIFENRSRNTYENAVFSRELANAREGENWLLVTSAFHMPRSVGNFRKAGWTIIPYPVGYMTPPDPTDGWTPSLTFEGRMAYLAVALREFAGYAYYYAMGRTDSLFPEP
ncbi:MAG: YdcF family protein [Proteobacteria bacterium]|nr:YdcF family protein [Pseudomonadota bacterium]